MPPYYINTSIYVLFAQYMWTYMNIEIYLYTHISDTTCIIHCPHRTGKWLRGICTRDENIYTDAESFHIYIFMYTRFYTYTCIKLTIWIYVGIYAPHLRMCECMVRRVGFFGVVVVKMGWPGTPISSPVRTHELDIAGGSEEYLIAEQEGFNKYKNDQEVRNWGSSDAGRRLLIHGDGMVAEDAADDENEIFGYNFLCKQKLAKFLELAICYIRYGKYMFAAP